MSQYYVGSNNEQTGPFNEAEFRTRWQQGLIAPNALCWTDGWDDWRPVRDFMGETSIPSSPPAAALAPDAPPPMPIRTPAAFTPTMQPTYAPPPRKPTSVLTIVLIIVGLFVVIGGFAAVGFYFAAQAAKPDWKHQQLLGLDLEVPRQLKSAPSPTNSLDANTRKLIKSWQNMQVEIVRDGYFYQTSRIEYVDGVETSLDGAFEGMTGGMQREADKPAENKEKHETLISGQRAIVGSMISTVKGKRFNVNAVVFGKGQVIWMVLCLHTTPEQGEQVKRVMKSVTIKP